eukprot:COSAG01_NODE_5167_length_4438_cov_16.802720_6_plen_281_part_00
MAEAPCPPQWEEGTPLSVGVCSADFEEYSRDVVDKLSAALPRVDGVTHVTFETYDLPSGTPTLELLSRHHVLLVWTASWTIAGGRSTRYDRSAAGDVLQRYVAAGGSVVQCYGNRPPGGAWERAGSGQSVGAWQGIELVQGVPADTPLRVTSDRLNGGAGGGIDTMLRALRVGGSMWVNTTSTRPGARVVARWPAGVGLDTPSPSDFITVCDHPAEESPGGARGPTQSLPAVAGRGQRQRRDSDHVGSGRHEHGAGPRRLYIPRSDSRGSADRASQGRGC